MHTIGITGGTGFIGRHLTRLLVAQGYDVVVFTRSASKAGAAHISYAHWDPDKGECDTEALKNLDAVVHLAGAGVAEKRLTPARKQEIIGSRVKGTQFLLEQLKAYAKGCTTLVAASAIGYYGPDKGGAPFTEDAPPHNDFLGEVCRQWENALLQGASFLRTTIIRIGIVLGKDGGAYQQLAQPMSFGVMPILGGGRQVVSWITLHDLVRLFVYALEHKEINGTYNGVAPNPVTHKELMYTICGVKGGFRIPAPVPAFFLRIMLGEMAEEVLKSATVSAEKTLKTGFRFDHTDITEAVKAIEGK